MIPEPNLNSKCAPSFVLPREGALTICEGGNQELLEFPCFLLSLSAFWASLPYMKVLKTVAMFVIEEL